ncbi:glutathione peroxidase [Wenyingzhuangia heitensis]|uniref:Glutathione peroxidase n=1 Tax=Wenyingzhuangia heitensis TaxID=1487859 RepID=A0ABX0UCG1_9FLAO|nr:glutathione peroxidase [Wenyingzhuangia heitensis]NIJ45575.1 glutathione peroxidase [Wenyingzhuangia heitensis]
MKYIYVLIPVILIGIYAFNFANVKLTSNKTNLYDFIVTDLQGNKFDFSTLKGKKILIVNTASKCGLTPQYKELQEIYSTYKDSHNFVVVGFPSNNFLFQEPGNNKKIEKFCELNYGVTFPMMSKIDVKGKDQAEIYQFLTHKKLNGFKDSKVKWNFQKYLIGRDGKLEKIINPKTKPNDASIVSWITK